MDLMRRGISRSFIVTSCLAIITAHIAVSGYCQTIAGDKDTPAVKTTNLQAGKQLLPAKVEDFSPRPGDPTRMEIRVSPAKRSYRPLEPIELVVELHNTSENEHIKIPMASSIYPSIQIDAIDYRGRTVEKTRYLKNNLTGMYNFHHLQPQASFRPKLLANLVNDLTDRGEYTIVAHAMFYSKANGGRRRVSSKPIKIRVEGEPVGSEE